MKMNEIIRERRRALGITQEKAAERLGVTASAFNKWERGASLPDIVLLPRLARLLGVDLNTLLDFSEELSDTDIGKFVNSLDGIASSTGYAAAFEHAEAKLMEYPSCDKLLLSTAYYLDGALYLYDVEDPEAYREKLDAWFERLSESTDVEIKSSALVRIINRCRASGDLERAEALINALPRTVVDRQEQLALLYAAQGRADDARAIWQGRALRGISDAVTAMSHLMDDALSSGRRGDAEHIADTIEAVVAAAHLPGWLGISARLELYKSLGDTEKCAELTDMLKHSLDTPWSPGDDPVYSTLSVEGTSSLAARLKTLIDRQ